MQHYTSDDTVTAGKRVLESYWQRHGLAVDVLPIGSKSFANRFSLPTPPPLVSIIIPTRNRCDLLRQCVEGIYQRTSYPKVEVLIIDNGSDEPDTIAYLESLQVANQTRVLRFAGPFNFASINNWAVMQAEGSCLCLLNNDVEPITPDWLDQMVAHAMRPDIGAVGALLYFPNDTIQHGGDILNGMAACHLHLGYPRGSLGYANRAMLTQNLSAVTAACLVVRKEIWNEVGGMDETSFPVAFNDVDFCLRVAARSYRNLWTPLAELYHHESASRGKDDTPQKRARLDAEAAHFQQRWGDLLGCDPAWNPNLALDGAHIRLANPPRIAKPWLIQNA